MDLMTIFQTLWPLIAATAILRQVGQVVKRVVPPATAGKGWRFFWQTFPLHPIVAGLLIGATGLAPCPDWVISLAAHAPTLFYGFAGYLSVNVHSLIRTWKKYKAGEQVSENEDEVTDQSLGDL